MGGQAWPVLIGGARLKVCRGARYGITDPDEEQFGADLLDFLNPTNERAAR